MKECLETTEFHSCTAYQTLELCLPRLAQDTTKPDLQQNPFIQHLDIFQVPS